MPSVHPVDSTQSLEVCNDNTNSCINRQFECNGFDDACEVRCNGNTNACYGATFNEGHWNVVCSGGTNSCYDATFKCESGKVCTALCLANVNTCLSATFEGEWEVRCAGYCNISGATALPTTTASPSSMYTQAPTPSLMFPPSNT